MNWLWKLWRWATPCWWGYLLKRPWSWRAFWCRIRGHPEGPIWYNPCGLEPDMHCKNCHDFLD